MLRGHRAPRACCSGAGITSCGSIAALPVAPPLGARHGQARSPHCPAPADLLDTARRAARCQRNRWPVVSEMRARGRSARGGTRLRRDRRANTAPRWLRRDIRSPVTRGESIEVVSGTDTDCRQPRGHLHRRLVGRVAASLSASRSRWKRPVAITWKCPARFRSSMPPVLYQDQSTFVTPMTGRLRSTSFMDFGGLDSPADPRHPAQLRRTLIALGYPADALQEAGWARGRCCLTIYPPSVALTTRPTCSTRLATSTSGSRCRP